MRTSQFWAVFSLGALLVQWIFGIDAEHQIMTGVICATIWAAKEE